jgi:hypothetical protein
MRFTPKLDLSMDSKVKRLKTAKKLEMALSCFSNDVEFWPSMAGPYDSLNQLLLAEATADGELSAA